MSPKGKMFIALAVAALAVPAAVSAQQSYGQSRDPQSYGSQPYGAPQSGQPDYDQQGPGPGSYDQGSYGQGSYGQGGNGQRMQGGHGHGQHAQASVYPQFRPIEKHIKHAVKEARRSNALAPHDAHNLMAQLHQIQAEEMQAYQAHGMNLPAGEQARIQSQLTQLAQAVDQNRGQQ